MVATVVTGDCAVLALPRGGVPVAAEVAAALHAPLDVLVVRKLGLPGQPELAFGAVASGADPDRPVQVRNDLVLARGRATPEQLDAVVQREIAELRRREHAYRGGHAAVDVAGRVAVVVDDGLATGASARAALLAVRARGPSAVVLAVPVAPRSTLTALDALADDVVCVAAPRRFIAVGRHYADFHQVTDAEVYAVLSD
ncbi:MAG TPA: phosphoribosyltransferase family protein [Pseudonocardiaceae bacterium]|jgi:predicted phosphoribosyltransferase